MTSSRRKLQEKLILIVKQKTGEKDEWVLPQGDWQDGETMREVCFCSTGFLKSTYEDGLGVSDDSKGISILP